MSRITSLEVLPPLIVAYLEETRGAYTAKELSKQTGYTVTCVLGVLLYMMEVGEIDKRRLRSNFYFLKDKYDDAEIKKIIEEGYLRRYNIKSIRRLVSAG